MTAERTVAEIVAYLLDGSDDVGYEAAHRLTALAAQVAAVNAALDQYDRDNLDTGRRGVLAARACVQVIARAVGHVPVRFIGEHDDDWGDYRLEQERDIRAEIAAGRERGHVAVEETYRELGGLG